MWWIYVYAGLSAFCGGFGIVAIQQGYKIAELDTIFILCALWAIVAELECIRKKIKR